MNQIREIVKQYPSLKNVYYTDYRDNETIDIDTSKFAKSFSEIKNTLLLQTSTCIIRHSLYPNGFEILTIQQSYNIEIRTNYPLQKDSNGRYQVLFD